MDLQEVNRSFITRASEVPTLREHFWNNAFMRSDSFNYTHRAIPIEALFKLAMEADVALWHNAPLELGAPKSFYHPSLYRKNLSDHAARISKMASSNTRVILRSREWDRYADRFVAALIASGYPADRPLYTTISNEVWNFSRRYHVSTRYAWGFGKGYGAKIGSKDWRYREGYGVLMARWADALEGALSRAGRRQHVVYVLEGQAANPDTTKRALIGMKTYFDRKGRNWTAIAPKVGVSVASYWGGKGYYNLFSDIKPNAYKRLRNRFESEARRNPNGLARRLANYYIRGSANAAGSKAWVVKKFADHEKQAELFGAQFIGAYEGGSHDVAPKFFSSKYGKNTARLKAWRTRYLWGREGARVNTAVNDALASKFPGIILSNYATVGPTGAQPWFEGEYNETNAMKRSWAKYYRRRSQQAPGQ